MRPIWSLLLVLLMTSPLHADAGAIVEPEWTFLAGDLSFPEGPAWDGRGTLYFSSCRGNFVGRIDASGFSVLVASASQPDVWQRTNGLTVGADGAIYAAEWAETGGAILRIEPDGRIEALTRDFNGARYNRPNDLIFDPQGNLYFTDPKSYARDKPDGVVYRIDAATNRVSVARAGFCFPNGLAFSADGRHLFLAESAWNRVLKLEVLADGSLGEPEVFVEMPGGDPDGMNFDESGNLYIAHFGGGHVWVVAPDGTVVRKLKTPGSKPSNVDFGGPDLRTLFVTEDESSSVYRTVVDVPGLPLFHHPVRSGR
ncbi:MAG: SMP-30/gluconolactonase/LRE family protein [Candidatus Sumerlaeia bacterium]|nr:SMP-30/gluconolactonase/LRE family protein [Candidatus Sumerlaeia bacterium]